MQLALGPKSLFGGAFQINLPVNAQDVSTFRQVPDNQEVFVNPSNNQSISVDIVEAVNAPSLEEAVKLHFEDIAECNSATSASVDSIEVAHIPDALPAILLRGTQEVAKFNNQRADVVNISLMLYRFTQYAADVLVCFNDPRVVQERGDVSGSDAWSHEAMLQCQRSLKLIDANIFPSDS